MKEIILAALNGVGKQLGAVLLRACIAAEAMAKYLQKRDETKKDKQLEKKREEQLDKIDDIAKNGTLEDLLDL